MKFEEIRRSMMLVNAIRLADKSERRGPLWGLVLEICGTGSTTATAICRECGWDPHQDASKEVRWNPEVLESEKRQGGGATCEEVLNSLKDLNGYLNAVANQLPVGELSAVLEKIKSSADVIERASK
jgi:hypothetical protein